jgi:hypothetical protein
MRPKEALKQRQQNALDDDEIEVVMAVAKGSFLPDDDDALVNGGRRKDKPDSATPKASVVASGETVVVAEIAELPTVSWRRCSSAATLSLSCAICLSTADLSSKSRYISSSDASALMRNCWACFSTLPKASCSRSFAWRDESC